jgi:hypothetical protein
LRAARSCGKAKQTKRGSKRGFPKLSHQQQEIGAESRSLVTAAMPKEAREPFLRESDVWVARFDAARPLAESLRTGLIEMQRLRQANLSAAARRPSCCTATSAARSSRSA